jgi:hypothetical protein
MGDENPADLTDFEVTTQQLMLRAFPTVKQPDFGALG